MASIETLQENAEDEKYSNNERVVCLIKIIENYTTEIIETDDKIYNLAQSEYGYEDNFITNEEKDERLIRAKQGANEIVELFDKALALSPNDDITFYLYKKRLDYLVNSELIDELFSVDFEKYTEYEGYFDLENLTEINAKAIDDGMDNTYYNQTLKDYKTTNYYPYYDYMGLNFGFTSNYGKDLWVGGEFSVDAVGNKNPFQIVNPLSSGMNFRTSSLGVSYMKNLNTQTNDFAFYPSKITNLFFLNINLLQFGFQWGDQFTDNSKYWFYRPEIGFSYGIFCLSYGYNFMFNKSVRDLTEKSVVSLKISYPLIKVGNV
jgi:hypothetical protein